jgi:hypothetical protein
VLLLCKHLPQIIDVGGCFILRQVGAGDFLCFLETAAQADHQCKVLTDFGTSIRLSHRTAQRDFGVLQIFRQQIRQSEIRKNCRFVGYNFEG